ncbi:unnamed protein product [Durusdinium trenchii]
MRRLQRGHPMGVYPLGNALFDEAATRRRSEGLGDFQRLGDERVLQLLRSLDAKALGRCSAASSMLRGFTASEELWQVLGMALLLKAGEGRAGKSRDGLKGGHQLHWGGNSWREAYICSMGSTPAQGKMARVYSDVLYRSFYYAATELDPAWLATENLERVSNLSTQDFLERFEERSCPVIVSGCVKHWPALSRWSEESLVRRFGEIPFAAGPVDFPLKLFYSYAHQNMDDVPMFIFDKYFATRAPELLDDYEVPSIFRGRDLFNFLGDEKRPDFRWLLIGNKRSGSKWHLDPNKTCAWNAVVRGRKRWLLLPPGCPPPGVHPSKDGAEVTQPVSLLEWFSNFYDELKRHVDLNPAWDLKEGTCGPGDLVFIPSGWWHCVLNLDDDTIAVTQNYASETHVSSVRRFLSEHRDQVSGTAERDTLAERFDEALTRHRPDLLFASDKVQKPEATAAPAQNFSFWDHLRSTGKSLCFETPEEPLSKKQRM